MANVLIQDSTMQEIADAIREKTGETASMLPREMPGKILGIATGGETSDTWGGEASKFDLTLTVVTGLSVSMTFYNVTAGNTLSADWGDGTSENATTTTVGAKTFTHTYPTIGNYTASIDSTGAYYVYYSGTNVFGAALNYTCTAARLGVRCTTISIYGLRSIYSLSSLTISNSLTTVSSYAFQYCYSLTSITIPSSVTSIGTYAFQGCYSIKKYVLLSSTPPTLSGTNAFTGINGICIMLVPKGSLEAYQTATNWATYADYMREMTDEEMIFYGLAAA